MNDKDFGDHLASSPTGDPKHNLRGTISDVRESEKKVRERDERIGLDCANCGDPLYKGENQKVRASDIPEDMEIQFDGSGFVCLDCFEEFRSAVIDNED